MSATELMNRLLRVLDEQIEQKVFIVTSVQYLAPRPGRGESVIPPTTPLDIAMNVIEANAFRRALEACKAALIEQHQKLIAPESIPDELGEEEKDGAESIY